MLRSMEDATNGAVAGSSLPGWQWDATLFQGCAAYYERGRLPYPPGLEAALTAALALDGRGRLLDTGCGPGTVALRLAPRFAAVVGLDADRDMLEVAAARAAERGIASVTWVCRRAEELPAGLGRFRVVTFAASFHWMEREWVAAAVRGMLEPGGAVVQISGTEATAPPGTLPYPPPPAAAMQALVRRYLGPERRAGQGVLRHGTPDDEPAVMARVGFGPPEIVTVSGGQVLARSIDDIVAAVLSHSSSAPHLFGSRLPAFEAELRALLGAAAAGGRFAQQLGDTELRIWRR